LIDAIKHHRAVVCPSDGTPLKPTTAPTIVGTEASVYCFRCGNGHKDKIN
jgi:hypothetical protein